MKTLIFLSIAVMFLFGCVNNKNMSEASQYPNCKLNGYCNVTGVFSIHEIDHVKMGKLITEKGNCINVSLSKFSIRKYAMKIGDQISVTGLLYETPAADEMTVKIEMDGRRIGWSQCNKVYIFVE